MTSLRYMWISGGSLLRVTFGSELPSPLSSHLLQLFSSVSCTDQNVGPCPLSPFPKYHSQEMLCAAEVADICCFACPTDPCPGHSTLICFGELPLP